MEGAFDWMRLSAIPGNFAAVHFWTCEMEMKLSGAHEGLRIGRI